MNYADTALILIGYQNDYFSPDGILHPVIEVTARVTRVLENTLHLLECLRPTAVLMVATPICFSPGYKELVDPVGILKTIQEVGAFRADSKGSQTIDELKRFGDRILEVPGKRGLNAFSNTDLASVLDKRQIANVVLAGAVTSICIDSTGRSAHERGHQVTVLSDCTCGRTMEEQEFYCRDVFPLYAHVTDHRAFLESLKEQV